MFTKIKKTLGLPFEEKKFPQKQIFFLNKRILYQVEVNNGIVTVFIFLEDNWLLQYTGILCDNLVLHAMNLLYSNVC